MPRPDTLTVGELADYTGYTNGTILNYSSVGRIPEPDEYKNENKRRPTKLWYPATIDRWMAARGKT